MSFEIALVALLDVHLLIVTNRKVRTWWCRMLIVRHSGLLATEVFQWFGHGGKRSRVSAIEEQKRTTIDVQRESRSVGRYIALIVDLPR
jgi:hypothetical protein